MTAIGVPRGIRHDYRMEVLSYSTRHTNHSRRLEHFIEWGAFGRRLDPYQQRRGHPA